MYLNAMEPNIIKCNERNVKETFKKAKDVMKWYNQMAIDGFQNGLI